MSWSIVYTRQAQKEARKIASSNLRPQVQRLLDILVKNPPSYEKLVGYLAGAYSRRVSIQHRLVYQIYAAEGTVKVLACGLTTIDRGADQRTRRQLRRRTRTAGTRSHLCAFNI